VNVLLLAGTGEAAELAQMLGDEPDVEVTASFARRAPATGRLDCRVRVGGFGGTDGLVAEIERQKYDAVVDATHPFAARMPWHVAAAAEATGVRRLRLLRPPWTPGPGDAWHEVADLTAAADQLFTLDAHHVLLTTGRMNLTPFARLAGTGVRFVVRSIEQPIPQPLVGATVLLARPPFGVADEVALLHEHQIDTLVTKNSGGTATAAKLTAARRVGLPVVVVTRPPTPDGPCVTTPKEALAWLTG
jgi:precorrin-6A/cobalt-precorrin-6A reductase